MNEIYKFHNPEGICFTTSTIIDWIDQFAHNDCQEVVADSNQLNHVDDGVAAGNYTDDIDDQSADNYSYDMSGNLIKDVQEGLTIGWNAYGKITQVNDEDSKQTIHK